MSERLKNRHVLLTGAGGGIGLAVAEACIAEGARCSIVDRMAAAPEAVRALLQKHPDRLAYIAADVTDTKGITHLLAEAQVAFGPIHTLFNNAAVFDLAPLLDSDEASFDKLFAVNVKGMFFVMQAVLRHMVEAGTQGASIINMASQAGRRGEALVSHYCATKAALAMAPHGIRVNGIAPGVVDTPMWDHVDSLFAKAEGLPLGEKKRRVGLEVPLGRMGVPSDIAGAAVFLASDEARYITAQTLNVDGGNVMS
jgi:D-sorbitol dehydrogenase (acceptor)